MTMNTMSSQLDAAAIFRAMADQTRLRILNLLRGGEICVCDLVDVLGVPQPTASRHLAYLRKTGLVQARKDGLWHYYRLTPRQSRFHKKLMDCLDACADVTPVLVKDSERWRLKGGQSCCE